ncbi:NAD(P)H-quinone oxidoreductase subunit 5 [Helianthus debilis subsp. tardiflorus]
MLFPILILILFTLFVGFLEIPFNQDVDILSKWLTPSINLLHQSSNNSIDWYEFCKDAVFFSQYSLFRNIYSIFFI